jgi:hypothetical protein
METNLIMFTEGQRALVNGMLRNLSNYRADNGNGDTLTAETLNDLYAETTDANQRRYSLLLLLIVLLDFKPNITRKSANRKMKSSGFHLCLKCYLFFESVDDLKSHLFSRTHRAHLGAVKERYEIANKAFKECRSRRREATALLGGQGDLQGQITIPEEEEKADELDGIPLQIVRARLFALVEVACLVSGVGTGGRERERARTRRRAAHPDSPSEARDED